MKKIGITSCFMYPDKQRNVFGPKHLNYLESDMARFVTRKGILPVLIPDVDIVLLDDILTEMDGFVFQGGSDVAPETYGENPIGQWKGDACRDRYELYVLDFAVRNNKPVLGICRGMQLMNVYFGGSLYQDIATQTTGKDEHRSAELYDTIKHPVNFVPGSYLDRLYKDESRPYVNTVHHQAVKELGKNLEVYATSPDGLIEAFGYTGAPEGKIIGVQWHPEFTHTLREELINEDHLYNAFLEHVKP